MTKLNNSDLPEIVIPKENAVFWLDKDGFWNNEGGRFELKKIIRRFHASIEKDADGYYVTQINGHRIEKVYFPYEDTALFAIDIQIREPMTMRLNTGKRLPLSPAELYSTGDSLYTVFDNEWIKLSERSLLKLSPMINYNADPWRFEYQNQTFTIRKKPT